MTNQELIQAARVWLGQGSRYGQATPLIERLADALEKAENEIKKIISTMRPG